MSGRRMQSHKRDIVFPARAIDAVGFLITPAQPTDALDLAAVHAEALPPGWSAAELAAYCGAANRHTLKAASDGIVHGFVTVQVAAGEAEILSLAVKTATRRQGVASSLMKAAIEVCRKQLVSSLYLEVAEGNSPARKLYEKFGFCIFASRQNYYQTARPAPESALIMRLDICGDVSQIDS
jgi:ribosomal-protein-alanine N-acetyltransferase